MNSSLFVFHATLLQCSIYGILFCMIKQKTAAKQKTAPSKKTVKTPPKNQPQKAREKVQPNEENILKPLFKRHCSYCGKPYTHAQRIIAGPPPLYPNICDECVEVCVKILMEEGPQDWRSRIISILAIETKSKNVKRVKKPNA